MTRQTDIAIIGMTCDGCVKSVTRALTQVPGVAEVDVSLERGEARVSFDDAHASRDALHEAIRDAGFEPAEG